MKKSFSVNIDGRIFNIDEDAYNLLQNYLQQLETAFGGDEDSAEIVTDIEARIAEHLSEMCPSSVVSIREINTVIDIIGRPEQIGAETPEAGDDTAHNDGRADGGTTAVPPAYHGTAAAGESRKLYRDLDDHVFGGVLSGLAKYNDWGVTTVRLCAVILALLTTVWPCILAYIIAWIIIPPAQTAEQKLRMSGIPVTTATIAQNVRDTANRAANEISNSFFSILGRTVAAIAGFTAGSIGAGCAIAAVVALFLMVMGIFTSPEWVLSHFDFNFGEKTVGNEYIVGLALLSALLAVIIPCLLVVWGACVALFKVKGPSRTTIITLCVVEFILIATSILLFNYLGAVECEYYRLHPDVAIQAAPAIDTIPAADTTTVTAPATPAAGSVGTVLGCAAIASAIFFAI